MVLDLETTGGAHTSDTITEIGAVKVRGGERIGELATLVDPGTGCRRTSSRSPASPPPWSAARRRSRPCCRRCWSSSRARCSWRTTPRSTRVPPRRLQAGTGSRGRGRRCSARRGSPGPSCRPRRRPACGWARWPGCSAPTTTPNHRALADARATVEVLHRLLERVGNVGVQSLPELLALASCASAHRPTTAQRRKRTLAEAVPSAPGVYLFRGPRDEVLYVGTSGDLRRRVRSYFTAGERRRRVRDMVALAERVDTVVCAHALEAAVRELRLIAAHRPRYNRRSRAPHHAWWVTTTAGGVPPAVGGRHRTGGGGGPFRSRQAAVAAVETVLDAVPVRACTQRIAAHGAGPARARCTSWGAAPPVRRAGHRPSTRPPSSPWPTCSRAAPTTRCSGCAPPSTATPTASGSRRRPACAIGSPRSRSPWVGRSGWRRSRPSRRSSARGRTGAAAGRSRWCATAASPPPGSPRAGCRRCR